MRLGGVGRAAGGRVLATLAGAGVLAALLAAPSAAPGSAPPAPVGSPACTGNSFSFANNTPAPISGGVGAPAITSTITVSGTQNYLRDIDLITNISHAHSSDLDVTLTSPAGTVVTITTDNGIEPSGETNVFAGTTWDDDAVTPVTDATLVNNVPSSSLIPEEAMAAFNGENPNGTWTLSIADDAAPDNGTLNSWSLKLATLEGTPNETQTISTPGTTGAIPNPTGSLNATTAIAGAGTYLSQVRLSADIRHFASGDLRISLVSPSTSTAISTNNGSTFDNVFGNGTIGTDWFDQAGSGMSADPGGGPVTDAEFLDDTVKAQLVPEGAMGAFIGSNPNGTWILSITDTTVSPIVPPPPNSDGGNLDGWSITVKTITGCTPAVGNVPPTADAGGPYAVAEGDPLSLSGSAVDSDGPQPLTYSWDVNGDGTFGDATGQNPTVPAAQLKALGIDGPATYSVKVLVFDGETSATSAAATLTVTNTPPTLAITGPAAATATVPGTWTFTSTDPGGVDQGATFTYRIDWNGDGTIDQTASGRDDSIDVSHTHPSAGDVTIRATSEDRNGGQSPEATKAVTVAAAPPSAGQTGPGATAPGSQPGKRTSCRKRGKRKHHHAASAKKKRGKCKKKRKKRR